MREKIKDSSTFHSHAWLLGYSMRRDKTSQCFADHLVLKGDAAVSQAGYGK